MSEAELKITHTTRSIKSKADAFGYGLAEGLGRALAYGFVFLALLWGIDHLSENDASEQPVTEQQ